MLSVMVPNYGTVSYEHESYSFMKINVADNWKHNVYLNAWIEEDKPKEVLNKISLCGEESIPFCSVSCHLFEINDSFLLNFTEKQ